MATRYRSARLSTKLRRAPTRYRPLSRLATGGMAEVWRAEAIFEDGRTHPVAIKRVRPELAKKPMWRSMFEDEARLGMKLRHENIARVYDARDIHGTYIMVMELVEGSSLKPLLDRAWERHARMPVPAALHILRELAKALDYAHTAQDPAGKHLGIVHRDVSPQNLLLSKTGAVKLTDFGLADASVHQTFRGENMVGGKLGYLAPEIVMQNPGDYRVDLFGAGVVVWEMLAGRRLFVGSSDQETVTNVGRCQVPPLRSVNPSVPEAVESLVGGLLARRPEDRIPSARLLWERLDEVLDAVGQDVGEKDVALMVGLHLAAERARTMPPPPQLLGLVDELAAFAEAAIDADYDLGAEPLDPRKFRRR